MPVAVSQPSVVQTSWSSQSVSARQQPATGACVADAGPRVAGLVPVARETVVALRVAGAAPGHDGVDARARVAVGARVAPVRGAEHAVVTARCGPGDGDAVAGGEVAVLDTV